MNKQVFIPTLKKIDHSIGCVYSNVTNMNIDRDKAHDEILKAIYVDWKDGTVNYNVERIAEGDFLGDRLEWLEEHTIDKHGRDKYVLTNTDGGVFLDMIKDGDIGTDDSLRHKAIAFVEEMTDDELDDMVVRSHDGTTHQWMEVEPDGTVHETEEIDNNTTHWIDYPTNEVPSIYNICSESAEACSCDICTMYRHFEDMDKEEFIESYSEEDWDYCNETSLDDAILEFERDNGGLTGEDIREQMITAIEELEYGYFDDEYE